MRGSSLKTRVRANTNAARALFLLLGLSLVAAGLARGEFSDVLAKAVRICLECIGIG